MNARTSIIIRTLEVLKKESSEMINKCTEVKVPLESFEWAVNMAIDQLQKLDSKNEELDYLLHKSRLNSLYGMCVSSETKKQYNVTIDIKEV